MLYINTYNNFIVGASAIPRAILYKISYNTVQYCTILYNTVQYCTIEKNIAHNCTYIARYCTAYNICTNYLYNYCTY